MSWLRTLGPTHALIEVNDHSWEEVGGQAEDIETRDSLRRIKVRREQRIIMQMKLVVMAYGVAG